MSASKMPTVRPRRARAIARLTVTDDLPTPPLPEGDGQDSGGGRDGRLGRILAGLPAGPGHDGGALGRVHGGDVNLHGAHPVQTPRPAPDVALDLGAQRAGGDGQCDVDHDLVAHYGDGTHHAQVDDGVSQFGVDDGAETLAHLLFSSQGWGGSIEVGPGTHGRILPACR